MDKIKHSTLVDIAYKWVMKASCGVAYKEIRSAGTTEIPDVIGFGSGNHSVMVEVKVSRSDFKRNAFKKHQFPMGKYRFFCTPIGMISVSELPEGWGLLQVNGKGKIVQSYNPFSQYLGCPPTIESRDLRHKGHATDFYTERNFMYSCLRRSFKKEREVSHA